MHRIKPVKRNKLLPNNFREQKKGKLFSVCPFYIWRPHAESNRGYRRERPVS